MTALFDYADMADFALMRLREGGIHPRDISIMRRTDMENRVPDTNTFAFVPAYTERFTATNALSPMMPDTPGLLFQNIGEYAPGSDAASDEVQLAMTIDNAERHRAKSIIVSAHGRRIHTHAE